MGDSLEVFHGQTSYDDYETLDPIRPRRHRKKVIILAIVILSLFITAAIYYLFIRNDDSANANSIEGQPVVVEDKPVISIVYAFGTSFESEAEIFSRLFEEESERESLYKIKKIGSVPFNSFSSNLMGFRVSERYAVAIDGKEIWGAKANDEAKLIFTLETGATISAITSSTINHTGTLLAFSVLNDSDKSNDLWVLDIDKKTAKVVKENITMAPFAWSSDGKTVFLGPNILGSGNEVKVPVALNIDDGNEKPIFESISQSDFGAYNVSLDGTKSSYIQPTVDKNKKDPSNFRGYYVGAPYKIFVRDLGNGQTSEVKDITTAKAPMSIVFDQLSNDLYWAEGTKLFRHDIVAGNTEEAYDTTEEDIEVVYAATSSQVVIGIKMPDNTTAVEVVDLKLKSRLLIMETTDATSAIGLIVDK